MTEKERNLNKCVYVSMVGLFRFYAMPVGFAGAEEDSGNLKMVLTEMNPLGLMVIGEICRDRW